MQKQYFIFKIKNEYLPEFIKNSIILGKINSSFHGIYHIEHKYFRKLKIQNIENNISSDDKVLLEYIINENFTHLLTQEEFIKRSSINKPTSGASGSIGATGTTCCTTRWKPIFN